MNKDASGSVLSQGKVSHIISSLFQTSLGEPGIKKGHLAIFQPAFIPLPQDNSKVPLRILRPRGESHQRQGISTHVVAGLPGSPGEPKQAQEETVAVAFQADIRGTRGYSHCCSTFTTGSSQESNSPQERTTTRATPWGQKSVPQVISPV